MAILPNIFVDPFDIRSGVTGVYPDPGLPDPAPPVVFSPITANDTVVYGSASAPNGSIVTITIGLATYTTTVTAGAWSKTVSALKPGQLVSAVVTHGGTGLTSSESYPVVIRHKPPIITPPLVYGDTSVPGSLTPTAVEPAGTSIFLKVNGLSAGSTTTDGSGNWTKSVSPLASNDVVTAYAGGNENVLRHASGGLQVVKIDDRSAISIGGYDSGSSFLDEVNLFVDRLGGFCTRLAPLSTGRVDHSAVLQGGKILVAGGSTVSESNTKTAELFNLSTGAWSAAANITISATDYGILQMLAFPISGNLVVFAGGRIVTPSGTNGFNNSLNQKLLFYNMTSNTWSLTASLLSVARYNAGACIMVSGKLLVVGGGDQYADLVDLNTLAVQTSSTGMATARQDCAVVPLPDGNALIIGGGDGSNTVYANCYIYDPVANTITATNSLTTARACVNAVVLSDGRIMAAGGHGASFAQSNKYQIGTYDTGTQDVTWATEGTMPAIHGNVYGIGGLAVPFSDARAVIIGGHTTYPAFDATTEIDVFDGAAWAAASGNPISADSQAFTVGVRPDPPAPPRAAYAYGVKPPA